MSDTLNPLGGPWKFLTGDMNWLDYGGKWCVHIRDTSLYHVIEFTNMDEAVGAENEGQARYHVELSEVDINNPQRGAALQSCGWLEEEVEAEAMVVEALHGYGARAPIWQDSGNNAHKLLRAAKAESHRLLKDVAAYAKAMHETPVNAIGSTAAEYARGDIQSAILRGVEQGDPKAELMLKFQGGVK